MRLAIRTGIAPDVWERQDPRAVATAIEMFQEADDLAEVAMKQMQQQ